MIIKTNKKGIISIECPIQKRLKEELPNVNIKIEQSIKECIDCYAFKGSSNGTKALIKDYMVANPNFIKCIYGEDNNV